MRKNEVVTPDVMELVVARAMREGKIHVERIGRVVDCGNYIAEKMIVFWLDTGIVVFRTQMQKIGDFPIISYTTEKYPNGKTSGIIDEILKLRAEYTSGIF